MAITLEQIAKMAGVSRSTASRVINNHPHVRPEVRERVWRIIREVGYEPNPAARALAARRLPDEQPDTGEGGTSDSD
ncbi:MAG: LacI family DNA-binding transcriptional regulator [Caldilineae bacterium]|nr:MAG: LacI family DNA-binding transcriptional regulator [Caldilineae bacterium]